MPRRRRKRRRRPPSKLTSQKHHRHGIQSIQGSKEQHIQHIWCIHSFHRGEQHQPQAQHQQTSCQDIWHHRCKGKHHSCRQNIQGSKDIQQLRCILCIQGYCRQERHQPQAWHQQTSCQDIWLHRCKGRHHSYRQSIQESKGIQQLRCILCIQGCCRRERHQPQAWHQQTSCQCIWLHRCKGRHHSCKQSILGSRGKHIQHMLQHHSHKIHRGELGQPQAQQKQQQSDKQQR